MTTTISKTRTDSQMKADVISELKWDARVDETDVGVQVHQGIVTLSGTVNAYAKQVAAREAAHRVVGVLDVVDSMRVKLPLSWERTDEDIAKAVRHALQWDVFVPDEKITSTVSSGLVTLTGRVDNWAQRREAERAIQKLSGVVGVQNQITVVAKPVSAVEIKQQIQEALERRADREAKRISVSVLNGVATLTGTVHSWADRNAIERVVGYAPGIQRIEDRTVVDPCC